MSNLDLYNKAIDLVAHDLEADPQPIYRIVMVAEGGLLIATGSRQPDPKRARTACVRAVNRFSHRCGFLVTRQGDEFWLMHATNLDSRSGRHVGYRDFLDATCLAYRRPVFGLTKIVPGARHRLSALAAERSLISNAA